MKIVMKSVLCLLMPRLSARAAMSQEITPFDIEDDVNYDIIVQVTE